jgi:hypothetical protein
MAHAQFATYSSDIDVLDDASHWLRIDRGVSADYNGRRSIGRPFRAAGQRSAS